MTETWVKANGYCPSCGNENLNGIKNNSPVADFICKNCNSEFELKSKKGGFASKVVDGAFKTMLERINSDNNPHFFFLNYSIINLDVQDFFVIPKYYFTDDIIEKRKPLSNKAKRAGWVGCNIVIQNIPINGKIFYVKNGIIQNKTKVIELWSKTNFIGKQKLESRSWSIEILKLIEGIKTNEFNLKEVYKFENELKLKFPKNNFIKDKIRQQLQILRDQGLLEFKGNGTYKKEPFV